MLVTDCCLGFLPRGKKKPKTWRNNLQGPKEWKSGIYILAEASFILTSKLCSKLSLLPFHYDKLTKTYISGSTLRRAIAYSFFTFHTLHIIFKLYMTFQCISEGHRGFSVALTGGMFLAHFGGWCLYMVAHVRPTETMDLLNSWPSLLSCLPNHENVKPFSGVLGALKVAALAPMCLSTACIVIALLGLYEIDGTYSVIARNLNLPFPHAFFHLESTIVVCELILAAFLATTLIASAEKGNVFLYQIRAIKITNLQTRTSLESLYSCGKVYERVLVNSVGFMIPVVIFGLSCCIIVILHNVVRYTEVPLLLRVSSAYVGFTELFAISAICWDYFKLTLMSDEVLWKLRTEANGYTLRLSRADREEVLKRSKGLRAWRVPVGSFTTFSLDVPVVVWEEILNQLLFLLNL